jgi:pantoate--beta-alanine ligase|tara:strand:+ start:235 stop:1062 length:828 start_codon:yes stop_codon:yes gene_type:complete
MTRIINKIDKKIFHEEKCFIPTMGALHEGHLSLVKLGKKSTNGKTIVSIFVNKRQFNDESDYDNYPIDLDKDIELLRKEEVDYIFIPQENYIYPKDFAELDGIKSGEKGSLFEGAHRPGHFDGVLTVVNRLFDLVNPTSVVFGKKDAQQLYLVKEFLANKSNNLKIIEAEIIRDEYGLAMSSRNRLLSKSGINIARNIFQILENTKEHFIQNQDIQQSEDFGKKLFDENTIEYDYLNFVDPKYFETPDSNREKLLLITAAYVQGIRLIDNMEVIQ